MKVTKGSAMVMCIAFYYKHSFLGIDAIEQSLWPMYYTNVLGEKYKITFPLSSYAIISNSHYNAMSPAKKSNPL